MEKLFNYSLEIDFFNLIQLHEYSKVFKVVFGLHVSKQREWRNKNITSEILVDVKLYRWQHS